MWYEKDSATQSDRKKTVLEMLPNELTNVLVAPKKTIQCYDTEWKEKPIINSEGAVAK
mgnify:CR=1 FL=1